VPESLLQILTFCLLLLVWLFLLRVIWAVWSDSPTPTVTVAPQPAGTAGTAGTAGAPAGPRVTSTATPPTAMKLKVVEPTEHKGETFDVADEVKIGRAATCQVALADDSYVSQLHARLFRRDGSLFIEDLGSTNGTFLNRKKLSGPVSIRRGDRIQVGRTVLEVSR
jgi:pSer/pThr/pTyr-binding forkhead associated (FHA) protein